MFGCFYKNELENKMPGMTIENIAAACEGTFVGDRALVTKEIAGAVTDSRQIQKDYLFIPIKGARVDGHDFIPQVFEKGALVVLSDHALPEETGPYILVSSTTEAMKKIAAFYRTQLSCKVVGITGSVGKTSTKEMIASVLEQRYKVLKTEGNFNNEIGLPLTIFKIRAKHEVAVLEMGISDFGEMHRLAAMARPDIGVITNIGLCHLENLGTRDGILQAKTEMFDHLQVDGTVILNGDDDKLSTKKEVNGKPVIFYGVGADSAFDIKKIFMRQTLKIMDSKECVQRSIRRRAISMRRFRFRVNIMYTMRWQELRSDCSWDFPFGRLHRALHLCRPLPGAPICCR